jgi:hypothetical protein
MGVVRWLTELFGPEPAPEPPPAPLRQITGREVNGPGSEIATLECGHKVHLYHHQLSEIPCRECGEKHA